MGKRSLSDLLSRNPFESPLTFGFFYREKIIGSISGIWSTE